MIRKLLVQNNSASSHSSEHLLRCRGSNVVSGPFTNT
jgi:hypothetical protein